MIRDFCFIPEVSVKESFLFKYEKGISWAINNLMIPWTINKFENLHCISD